MLKLSEKTQETLNTLKILGIKFNIVTPVDHRIELHFEHFRLNGKSEVHFVAEIDGYGNITEFGPYWPDWDGISDYALLDGQLVRV